MSNWVSIYKQPLPTVASHTAALQSEASTALSVPAVWANPHKIKSSWNPVSTNWSETFPSNWSCSATLPFSKLNELVKNCPGWYLHWQIWVAPLWPNRAVLLGPKCVCGGGGWSPIYMRSDQSGIGMGTSLQIGQIPVVPEVHIPATMRAEGCVLQPSWNIKAALMEWRGAEMSNRTGAAPQEAWHSVLLHSHAVHVIPEL